MGSSNENIRFGASQSNTRVARASNNFEELSCQVFILRLIIALAEKEFLKAEVLASTAMKLAKGVKNEALVSECNYWHGITLYQCGHLDESIDALQSSLSCKDSTYAKDTKMLLDRVAHEAQYGTGFGSPLTKACELFSDVETSPSSKLSRSPPAEPRGLAIYSDALAPERQEDSECRKIPTWDTRADTPTAAHDSGLKDIQINTMTGGAPHSPEAKTIQSDIPSLHICHGSATSVSSEGMSRSSSAAEALSPKFSSPRTPTSSHGQPPHTRTSRGLSDIDDIIRPDLDQTWSKMENTETGSPAALQQLRIKNWRLHIPPQHEHAFDRNSDETMPTVPQSAAIVSSYVPEPESGQDQRAETTFPTPASSGRGSTLYAMLRKVHSF